MQFPYATKHKYLCLFFSVQAGGAAGKTNLEFLALGMNSGPATGDLLLILFCKPGIL